MKKWIIGATVVAVALAAVFLGKNYYDKRYVGSDYYAMVPLDMDVTPEQMKSTNGEDMGQGKEYILTAYSEEGTEKKVEFNVYLDDQLKELPQPGSWMRINASKQIVLKWYPIEKSEVPATALARIEQGAAH
jgi:uncharacterized protein (TIGR01655 family)